jgi:hypothetical protein
MRRGTARHERSNLSKKSNGLLPEAEEAARIDQRIPTRPAQSQTADGRMRRRRKHEEPQMTMEEREHLAQVDQL